jgi:diacylglycerol kinase (ATP)
MTKHMILLNPIAGKGGAARLEPEIVAALQAHKLQFDLVRTKRIGHAIELAQKAVKDKYDVVVAAGGDGTSNEVLNGLMLAKKKGARNLTMGFIPVGRGNDFAFSMGAAMDWKTAVDNLARGKKQAMDVGIIYGGNFPKGRYFGNGVGIGFDAVVGFVAAKMKLTGFMAYLVAALKTIFIYFKAPTVKLELDKTTITQPNLMVSIMNGFRMGGTFLMAPKSKHDDGVFDLCIAGQVSRLQIFTLIGKFMKGAQEGHPAIRFERSRKILATAVKGTLPVHADGETVCEEGKQVKIELLPRQLNIIV